MKRFLVFFLAVISVLSVCAQGMTDQQVMNYIARQRKAGVSQSQIVTGLMQRGVNMEQIRRLRNQVLSLLLWKHLSRTRMERLLRS